MPSEMEDHSSAISLSPLTPRSAVSSHLESDVSSEDETLGHSGSQLPPDSAAVHHEEHEELPPYSRAPPNQPAGIRGGHGTTLRRSVLALFLSVIYAALALYSWVIFTRLSFRPIYNRSWQAYAIDNEYSLCYSFKPMSYAGDAGFYRSAQIIQSIVSVLTLPLIAAVCASAAVVFVQNQKDGMSMSMRHVMTLADNRWMDLSLVHDVFKVGWKRCGSALLILGVFLHFIGAIVYPIQSIFLTSKSIYVPTLCSQSHTGGDIGVLSSTSSHDIDSAVSGMDVVMVRSALQTANLNTFFPQLWQRKGGQQFNTFSSFADMTDPFYAEVPTGFNTGVLRQFAPRVNSSTTYSSIKAAQWPANCDLIENAFFASYSAVFSDDEDGSWAVTACMPADVTQSPWSSTRDRQEFTETLYLNISFPRVPHYEGTPTGGALFEINVTTTAGYFELPNYMNDEIPGPLLESDPTTSLCGADCIAQATGTYMKKRVRRSSTSTDNTTVRLNNGLATINKGPLLTTAYAMFGPGSFIEAFPADFSVIGDNFHSSNAGDYTTYDVDACVALAPAMNLFSSSSDALGGVNFDNCISINFIEPSELRGYAQERIESWLVAIYTNHEQIPNAFTSAAFLSNKHLIESMEGSWSINQDLGSEMEIPDISLGGIVTVSVLMGLYLLPLLALALYASRYPRWTRRLDSFAMLRLGASMGEEVFPMLVAYDKNAIKELDEIPGVVRDIGHSSGTGNEVIRVGRIGLGGGKPLQTMRRYQCFEGDNQTWNIAQRIQMHRSANA